MVDQPRGESDEDQRRWLHLMFSALPGYPFFPCKICISEGFGGMGGCDHTVRERAMAAHPGFDPAPHRDHSEKTP